MAEPRSADIQRALAAQLGAGSVDDAVRPVVALIRGERFVSGGIGEPAIDGRLIATLERTTSAPR